MIGTVEVIYVGSQIINYVTGSVALILERVSYLHALFSMLYKRCTVISLVDRLILSLIVSE